MIIKSKMMRVFPALIIILFAFCTEAYPQAKPKIKSMTVTEEKHEKGNKKVMKDSEKKYDANGNLLEEINYKNGEFDSHTVCEYDSNNNKTKETELDKSGNVISVTVTKYDENGLKAEKSVYDGKGALKSKKTYRYTLY